MRSYLGYIIATARFLTVCFRHGLWSSSGEMLTARSWSQFCGAFGMRLNPSKPYDETSLTTFWTANRSCNTPRGYPKRSLKRVISYVHGMFCKSHFWSAVSFWWLTVRFVKSNRGVVRDIWEFPSSDFV